ncbi:MAG: cytochrome c biogenesis protein CcdA [Candidatus Dependentiae bacterium]
MIKRILSLYSLFIINCCFSFAPNIEWETPSKEATVSFMVPIDQEDALYREYIDFSCDQEWITIHDWKTDIDAVSVYDPIFKENKKIYTQDVTFNIDMTIKKPVTEATLRFTFYRKNKGSIEEKLIHLPLQNEQINKPSISVNLAADVEDSKIELEDTLIDQIEPKAPISLSCKISNLIEHTNSLWLQCLLILLLGALLSLTPCIYPMIPITVGILQGQGSTSFLRNLFVSLCYTMGVATTFALLGTVAAYTGKLFGTFMQSPFVILSIVALLLYLALSMFGLYDMYIPKGFQSNNRFSKGGSPITAFLFGIVSGTVASPCVSPGLALVLSIVTGLGNPFLGFIFLFAFGVGLSLPLMIIGTFSSSLNVLPKAGMWMVEIKKLFGFLMVGMSIYFLGTIIPAYVTTWLFTLLILVAGLYYLKAASKQSTSGKLLYNILGMILIAGSIIFGYFAIRASFNPQDCTVVGLWTENYTCAREQAHHEHKKLLLKVEAPCCSMCTAIDKKFFRNSEIINTLEQAYIPVHIDGSDTVDPTIPDLVKKFSIVGFPTILIIDPIDEVVLKKWASDLYDYSIDEFKQILIDSAR